MQKRNSFIFLFLFLALLSVVLFFAFKSNSHVPGAGVIVGLFTPMRSGIVGVVNGVDTGTDVQDEVARLQKELRLQKKQDTELRALRDQFETQQVRTHALLPARIIGMKGYIPGVSLPDGFVIDKGSSDGIMAGQVVIYKDNVIGKIQKVAKTTSLIVLIYNEQVTINAKTLKTNALGLVKGQGQGVMQLSGVVLSEKLEKGDQVLTKGDMEINNTGYPPDIVIGKIVSVDKKASSLFQSAQVASLVPIAKLTIVFIMTGE
jgi:cell shape-determining protein MreC